MHFKVKTLTNLRAGPSREAGLAERMPIPNDSTAVEIGREEHDGDTWVRLIVRRADNGRLVEGWMRLVRLVKIEEPPRPALDVPRFLATCIDAERLLNQRDGVTPHYVLADYLVAWAICETDLANLGPMPETAEGEGPFQFDTGSWARFIESGLFGVFRAVDRHHPLHQCFGAAAIAHLDLKAIAAEMESHASDDGGETDEADKPYIASLGELYLAWIVGRETAVDLVLLERDGGGDEMVRDAVGRSRGGDPVIEALERRDIWFLESEGEVPRTVSQALQELDRRVTDALARAHELIRDHLPEEVPEAHGGTPWMDKAREEERRWAEPGVSEGSSAGKTLIRRYFAATDHPPTDSAAWCGAFAAWCMRETGFADEIVRGAARAANWKGFGVGIDAGGEAVRPGSVVVLSPAPGTASSGHVGFLVGFDGDKAILLGGNQSDEARETPYPRSRIVAVRWPASASNMDASASEAATGDFGPLLDLIAKHESRGNYNAHFGNAGNTDPEFTKMTLRQVLNWQHRFVTIEGKASSAVGRYQFIRMTLADLITRTGKSENARFTPGLQDEFATALLVRRGLKRYLSGQLSLDRFGNSLAKEWAALPVLTPVTRGRRTIKVGQSYYAGDGLNRAHARPEEVREVLLRLR